MRTMYVLTTRANLVRKTFDNESQIYYLRDPNNATPDINSALIFETQENAQRYLDLWCHQMFKNSFAVTPIARPLVQNFEPKLKVTRVDGEKAFVRIESKDGLMKIFMDVEDAEHLRDELMKILANEGSPL